MAARAIIVQSAQRVLVHLGGGLSRLVGSPGKTIATDFRRRGSFQREPFDLPTAC
jgi:hypothetical protein